MISRWPTDKERIREYMGIPVKKKMEWLYQMNRFMQKVSFSNSKVKHKNLNSSLSLRSCSE